MFYKTYIKPDTDPLKTIVRAVKLDSIEIIQKVTQSIKLPENFFKDWVTQPGDWLIEDPDHHYKGTGNVPYEIYSNALFTKTYEPFDGKYLLSGGPCNV